MAKPKTGKREGSLEAPIRHPIPWQDPEYYQEEPLYREMARIFNICHGCRRCVSLCNAFPTLFDLVDVSATLEVDGVAREDYRKVVDHCYLCDLCYMTKCPYVPPHEWNVDFPHLMLRAKALRYKTGRTRLRDRMLAATDVVGSIAGIPVIAQGVNAVNRNAMARWVLDKSAGIHPQARLPEFHSDTLRKRFAGKTGERPTAIPTEHTRGRVALFVTCYGNRHMPDSVEDLMAVFEHNDIPVTLVDRERCCGMPSLELGDLEAVEQAKAFNIPQLSKFVEDGWDIVAPVPSCVLMFKQEIPLMFPDDKEVQAVRDAVFDPFEYMALRHRAGKLKTGFRHALGRIAYHAPCHQRVQNIGLKTRDILALVPDTTIEIMQRCSGHDGTYAVKSECHAVSMKICRPVANRIRKGEYDHYASDCPMAGRQIESALDDGTAAESPFTLLRHAYGI